MNKKVIENSIMVVSLLVFCALTIYGLLNHLPWYDETHNWMLVRNLNFHNLLPTLHSEGHFIIWYLLTMPFAKLNLCYPYSILFLNWLIYFIAMLIMWKKAPFNPVLKATITFSWLSINYFPIIARCYCIGILGLFVLADLYKKQTRHPILYSSAIIFTAHTSLLATFAVVPLALIFIHELIKTTEKNDRKKLFPPFVILFIGIIFWCIPFLNGYGTAKLLSENPPSLIWVITFLREYYFIGIPYIICCLIVLYYADNKIKFFLSSSILQFVLFYMFIYSIYAHHLVLLYIYLIVALWLTPELHKRNIPSYIFLIVFFIFSNLNLRENIAYAIENTSKIHIINYINEQNIDYVLVPSWKYYDIEPLIHDKPVIEYDDQAPTGKEEEYFRKQILQKRVKKDKKNWKALVLTLQRINDKSVEINWDKPSSYYYDILYITEFTNR